MKIMQTTALTEKQIEEIMALEKCCKDAYPLKISFPLEEEASFYLLYDPELVCALALIPPAPGCPGAAAECVAFTLPLKQRRGYFTALFDAAETELGDIDLLFLTDHSNEGAARTLEALCTEFDYNEHRMELNLRDAEITDICPDHLRLFFHIEQTESAVTFTFSLKNDLRQAPIGNCRAECYSEAACLYGFELLPALRGIGLGKEAFLLSINYLKTKGIVTAFLQVSGDNEIAVHLYEKTGFRITETLSYYLY